jgi:N utilization substance protein B
MGKRRAARELALKMLFEVDVGKTPVEDVLAALPAEKYGAETVAFARQLLEGAVAEREHIDALLRQYAEGWSLGRMANVDRNILRLASYEILYLPDIPASVTIDEAVELAKKFSTAESGKFVNGILGHLVRHFEETPVAPAAPAAPDEPATAEPC